MRTLAASGCVKGASTMHIDAAQYDGRSNGLSILGVERRSQSVLVDGEQNVGHRRVVEADGLVLPEADAVFRERIVEPEQQSARAVGELERLSRRLHEVRDLLQHLR